MSLARPTGSTDLRTIVREHLGDERRRVLEAVLGRPEPVPLDELAAELSAGDRRKQEALHVELVHRHLPALEEAGLVAWDRDAVTVTDALAEPELRRLLDEEDGQWAGTADCLADERRRTVLAIVVERGSTSRRALAQAVAGREAGGEPSEDEVEEALVGLHHVHLPKLADAGLLEYDDEEGAVCCRDQHAPAAVAGCSGAD